MKRLCPDAGNLDIPDEVMEHPLICNLGEAANDLVTWSNVSVSPFFQPSVILNIYAGHLFVQRRAIQG